MNAQFLKVVVILTVLIGSIQGKESRIGPRLQPGVPRIINGVPVTEQWDGRWVCSLHDLWYGDYHLCGCNIIDERTALTAGHCVSPGWQEDYFLYCGNKTLANAAVTTGVARIIRHENYSSETLQNDLSMLKLKEPLVFDDKIKNVVLTRNTDIFKDGTTCEVYGWGAESEDAFSNPPHLMKTDVDIIPMKECISKYSVAGIDVDPISMICAGNPGKDSCQGDSGGPLICRGNVLCGTVSWGIGCARPDFPGVYANVTNFYDWIMQCTGDKCFQAPANCDTCCN